MLEQEINLAYQFHKKNDLQLSNISQYEMYERNNLLLEELSEYYYALEFETSKRQISELVDIYYILLGNLTAIGCKSVSNDYYQSVKQLEPTIFNYINVAGSLAQQTRKNWNQNYDFIYELTIMMIKMIIKEVPNELFLKLKAHHERVMQRERKKIGDSYVISHFGNPDLMN